MESPAAIASALSSAFVAGDLNVESLVGRGSSVLGKRWRWLRPLAGRVAEKFAGGTRPRLSPVTQFILADRGFRRACRRHELRAIHVVAASPTMCPVAAAESWRLPAIRTSRELADWLNITIRDLDWLADLRGLERKQGQRRLRHYHYRTLTKQFGHARLVEAPKPLLKAVQRRILTGILNHIPSHAAVHGFRLGRSIKTFAAPHVGQDVVLKIDLQDFFPSISLPRIRALYRTVGYPERTADLLAGFCTNSAPEDVWEDQSSETPLPIRHARHVYSQPHLPQGAPTSPALANLCAYRMDCRLAGLARAVGAVYTRYADDLAFSGDDPFRRVAKRFHLHVCATVMEEGFTVHHRKTRIMQRSVRQRLAGIVVNDRLNVSRDEFDRLKAILTNCVRCGPASQNRSGHDRFRQHLDGRVAFVEAVNPAKGARLRGLYEQICW